MESNRIDTDSELSFDLGGTDTGVKTSKSEIYYDSQQIAEVQANEIYTDILKIYSIPMNYDHLRTIEDISAFNDKTCIEDWSEQFSKFHKRKQSFIRGVKSEESEDHFHRQDYLR